MYNSTYNHPHCQHNAKGRGAVKYKLNYKFFTNFVKIVVFTYRMSNVIILLQ